MTTRATQPWALRLRGNFATRVELMDPRQLKPIFAFSLFWRFCSAYTHLSASSRRSLLKRTLSRSKTANSLASSPLIKKSLPTKASPTPRALRLRNCVGVRRNLSANGSTSSSRTTSARTASSPAAIPTWSSTTPAPARGLPHPQRVRRPPTLSPTRNRQACL